MRSEIRIRRKQRIERIAFLKLVVIVIIKIVIIVMMTVTLIILLTVMMMIKEGLNLGEKMLILKRRKNIGKDKAEYKMQIWRENFSKKVY